MFSFNVRAHGEDNFINLTEVYRYVGQKMALAINSVHSDIQRIDKVPLDNGVLTGSITVNVPLFR